MPDPVWKDWCLLTMNLGLPTPVAKLTSNNLVTKWFLLSPIHVLL